ncbi:MAG: amidophosphoribosyltransferase [Planctomycetes bacterium]|nr:amidophosphoribosyltransferase [Planctomycetota bacterium]
MPRHNCGLFGVCGAERAADLAHLGLYALQHRGQESAGIAASDGRRISCHKGMGLVSTVFADKAVLKSLPGRCAIGHNRYSTTGSSRLLNAQPLCVEFKCGPLAAAHNGNLVNAAALRRAMEQDGSIFQTTSDSEIVLHLVARAPAGPLPDMIAHALSKVAGAYCFLFLAPDELIAVRDSMGFRPLCLGSLGGATVVASESCALDIVGAEYVRGIEPGEMLVLGAGGMTSRRLPAAPRLAMCIFEYIYIARPDSRIFGTMADKVRRAFGRRLAEEHPAGADIVIGVPDSANTAALGYSEASGTRFEIGLIRSHYVGRTFIDPHQSERDLKVHLKFNPVTGVLKGRRVVVVEDSIVRGTTLRQLVRLIRRAGAAEVHVRVGSPPIRFPCFYGVDMSTRKELIASSHTVDEVREFIGANSLGYLPVEGMLRTVPAPADMCTACFTGDYPTAVPEDFQKERFDAQHAGVR